MTRKKSSGKIDIGAIIIAVITLIGTLGGAYIISLGNINTTEIIISATTTAQARITSTVEPSPTFTPIPLIPELILSRTEELEVNGENWTRYFLEIKNWRDFSPELFITSPNLPPCGSNTNSSRAWVQIYDGDYDYVIRGYCNLSSPLELQSIWFHVVRGTTPPNTVYVVINDRLENKLYVTNEIPIK